MSDPIVLSSINRFGLSSRLRNFIPPILPINAQKNLFSNTNFVQNISFLFIKATDFTKSVHDFLNVNSPSSFTTKAGQSMPMFRLYHSLQNNGQEC